jgi:hypothetical protein
MIAPLSSVTASSKTFFARSIATVVLLMAMILCCRLNLSVRPNDSHRRAVLQKLMPSFHRQMQRQGDTA